MAIYKIQARAGLSARAYRVSLHGQLLTHYVANSVAGTPGVGPDASQYSFDLPDGEAFWAVFGAVPASFADAIGMIITVDLLDASQEFYFTRPAGEILRAIPDSASMANYLSDSVLCDHVSPGLYRAVVSRSASLVHLVYPGNDTPVWGDHVGQIVLGSLEPFDPPTPPGGGLVPGYLSVDYEDDYLYLEGIEYDGFEFGPDREATQTAPSAGVAIKRGSPSDIDIAVASATYGFVDTDMVMVIWSRTLRAIDGSLIRPKKGDIVVASDGRWIIKGNPKQNQDGAQWRCNVRLSTLEIDP